MPSNDGFNIREPITHLTTISIEVEWIEHEDVLIPENKKIIDTYIVSTDSKILREAIGDKLLLELCEAKERENAES